MAALKQFLRYADAREFEIDRAIRNQQNELFKLINESFSTHRLMSVTLANRKVYVGFAARRPTLSNEDQILQLIPVLSGYRDKDNLQFVFTTTYPNEGVAANPLSVSFPVKDIQIANFFDLARYREDFEAKTPLSIPVPLELDF